MRLALIMGCGCAAVLVACPLPEDQFVLSGRVVDSLGHARPGAEVRLLRNRFASERRCDALAPLASTQADDQGRYGFTLVRQQITGGVEARRFFRVEADFEPYVVSQTFWFPDADLDLGALSDELPPDVWGVTEHLLDGHVAGRNEGITHALGERGATQRSAFTAREWWTVPIDSLGRYDIVPVEWERREELVQLQGIATLTPASRGAECPFIDVTPCPLTDGRYVPYEFPENTRTIVLNFKKDTDITPITFHGLVLERPATRARFEFNFVLDFDNWSPLGLLRLDVRLQERSAARCEDPGVFVNFSPPALIKPVLLRVAFQDDAGDLVPILALSEISTQ